MTIVKDIATCDLTVKHFAH